MLSLKQQKEDFVSGLLGGEITEIYKVTTIALTSYASLLLLKSLIYDDDVPILFDFVINCLTMLVSITIYSNRVETLHYLIIIPSILTWVFARNRGNWGNRDNLTRNHDKLLVKKPFLTGYRSHMIIITNLAILAVDFKIFPRRFAKVETWGTSLMDLGVGSFVFSMGLVSSRNLFKKQLNKNNYISIIGQSIYKSIPILILGIARLISVKSLDYQEHVTEYGIHWNFFITLGFLPILLAIFDPILNYIPRNILAFLIIIIYEITLTKTSLLEYILTPKNRMNNLITMNKEGIFSFWGYFAIFLFGQSFSFIMTNYKTNNNLFSININRSNSKFSVSTKQGLIILSIFYQLIFNYINTSRHFMNVSRRLGNMPYVLWVVSYNSSLLLGYCLISELFPSIEATSPLLEAINNNGLLAFLLGNLGTGLVNMSINTLQIDDKLAFIILVVYTAGLLIILLILNKYKIYIKL